MATSKKNQTSKNATSKNQQKSTDLAVPNEGSFLSLTKDDVPAQIKFLEDRLKTLKGDTISEISTDIMYGDDKNIKDITSLKELMAISASIRARSAAFQKEVIFYELEGKVKPFTETDKTPEEWYEIIRKAKNELVNSSQIKIIENSIKSLSKHLSEKDRIANDLKVIMEEATALLD